MSSLERIALFIDGANLYASAKALGFDIDYKRLLKEFQAKGRLIRAFYYTALVDDQEYSSVRPLVDWLDYNGYSVVTKPTKEFVDSTGRRKVKGNMDIELAVNAMDMAPHLDLMVLFSGDGDFRSLVESVQRKGVRVAVVSTISTQPPMVADELRRQADEFIDLAQLIPRIGRDPGDRPQRPVDHRRQSFAPFSSRSRKSASRATNAAWLSTSARRTIARIVRGLRLSGPRTAPPFRTGGTRRCRLLAKRTHAWRSSALRRDCAAPTGRASLHRRLRGELLYATLIEFGFASGVYDRRPDDGLTLVDCAIVNAVRCVPPQNKPTPEEIATCRRYLRRRSRRCRDSRSWSRSAGSRMKARCARSN